AHATPLGRVACEASAVFLPAAGKRGLFEGSRKALRTRFVFTRFAFERRPKRRREAAPTATGQLGKVALERLNADIGFGRIGVLRWQQDALRMYHDANRAGLAVRRSGIFGNLRNLGGDQVAIGQRTGEFEVQLRETQREPFPSRPAGGSGPDDERIG